MPLPIFLSAFLVLLVLITLAWRRPNRRYLAARLAATAVAVGALVCLASPPRVSRKARAGEAILLTPGYHVDSLRALRRRLPNQPPVFRLDGVAGTYPVVASPAELKQRLPGLRQLHLLGWGLEILTGSDSVQLCPHLSSPPAGVVALHWEEKPSLGQQVNLSGRYYNPQNEDTRLYLRVANRAVDSVLVRGRGYQSFALRYVPKQEGRFLYTIAGKKSRQMQTLGQVPVQVQARPKWRILLLPAAPDFEFKFLKNHLAQSHAVAWRIPVSKNHYQTEFLNLPARPLHLLSPALLRQFDLVITEPAVLGALTKTESQALTQAVTQDGLGLLAVAATPMTGPRIALLAGLDLVRYQGRAGSAAVTWPGQDQPLAHPAPLFTLKKVGTAEPLATSPGGMLAVSWPRGYGRVGCTVLAQTFSWLLAGQATGYATYWSHLLGNLVPAPQADHHWLLPDPLAARTHAPVPVLLNDYGREKHVTGPTALIRPEAQPGQALALRQDEVLGYRFTGLYRPRTSGWHQVQKEGGAPFYFYVQPDSAWTAAAWHQTWQQTAAYIRKNHQTQVANLHIVRREPVPGIWFLVLFLLAAGFLWWEEKW